MSERKLILELSFYTDGDWGFGDITWLTDHVSRYFDQNFYEYTLHEEGSYELKLRRIFTFEDKNDADVIVDFIEKIRSGLHGNASYLGYVNSFLERAEDDLQENGLKCKGEYDYLYFDDMYGNTEAKITLKTTDKYVPEIKEIIYVDEKKV